VALAVAIVAAMIPLAMSALPNKESRFIYFSGKFEGKFAVRFHPVISSRALNVPNATIFGKVMIYQTLDQICLVLYQGQRKLL
jgi:hypothetical protein